MLGQSIFAVHTCSRLVRRYRLTIQSRLLITVLVSRLEDTDTRQGSTSICQRRSFRDHEDTCTVRFTECAHCVAKTSAFNLPAFRLFQEGLIYHTSFCHDAIS